MGFKCNNCGFCCKGKKDIQVNLTIGDIYRICEKLMITVEDFFDKYAGLKPFGDPRTPKEYDIDIGLNMPCPFYKDNKCTIYNARPVNCRIFPYWLLVRAPKDKLNDLLKGKCEYTLDKKSLKAYKKYQDAIAKVLLEESSYYDIKEKTTSKKINKKPNINEIKSNIIVHLDSIKFNKLKLIESEKILSEKNKKKFFFI